MSNLMTNGNTMKWLLLPAQMHCIASKQRALYLHDTPRAHAFSPAQLTWRIEQVMRAVFTFCQKTYTHTHTHRRRQRRSSTNPAQKMEIASLRCFKLTHCAQMALSLSRRAFHADNEARAYYI